MTDAPSVQKLQRTKRRWLLVLWCSALLLALSIILGMGTTLSRLKQTMQLVDDASLSEAGYEEMEEMIQRTMLAGTAGLILGSLAFLAYLCAVLMHHRARQQIQRARDEDRQLTILEELLEEEDHT